MSILCSTKPAANELNRSPPTDQHVFTIIVLCFSFDVTVWSENTPSPRDYVIKNVANKSAILCFLTDKIDVELLNAAGPTLKVVSTFSVGYDHIDVAECNRRGVKIGYTPDVLTEATAELTVSNRASAYIQHKYINCTHLHQSVSISVHILWS